MLKEFLTAYQERRKNVTDEDVALFTSVRPIDPNPGVQPIKQPPKEGLKEEEPKEASKEEPAKEEAQ